MISFWISPTSYHYYNALLRIVATLWKNVLLRNKRTQINVNCSNINYTNNYLTIVTQEGNNIMFFSGRN